jgi:ribosomal protein S6
MVQQMVQYETLILTVPEITIDESKQIEKQLDTVLQKHKSAKISFDRWGKYKLAQQVNKNNYGVYFLARYEIPAENKDALLEEVSEHFTLKLANVIMRFMNTNIDSKKGLEYTKPTPLDESTRDVDKFLKDNKIDSMVLDKNKKDTSEPVKEAATATVKAEVVVEKVTEEKSAEAEEKKEVSK